MVASGGLREIMCMTGSLNGHMDFEEYSCQNTDCVSIDNDARRSSTLMRKADSRQLLSMQDNKQCRSIACIHCKTHSRISVHDNFDPCNHAIRPTKSVTDLVMQGRPGETSPQTDNNTATRKVFRSRLLLHLINSFSTTLSVPLYLNHRILYVSSFNDQIYIYWDGRKIVANRAIRCRAGR